MWCIFELKHEMGKVWRYIAEWSQDHTQVCQNVRRNVNSEEEQVKTKQSFIKKILFIHKKLQSDIKNNYYWLSWDMVSTLIKVFVLFCKSVVLQQGFILCQTYNKNCNMWNIYCIYGYYIWYIQPDLMKVRINNMPNKIKNSCYWYAKTAYYMHAKHMHIIWMLKSIFCISIPQVFILIWRTIYTHFHELIINILTVLVLL